MISNVMSWLSVRWLFVSTIILFGILIITPVANKLAFVPDYLNLSQVNSKEYFGLIIGAIASIFGILMAVILLTVEVFKEKLHKNEHTNPVENELIRNAIYNSINLIGLSFISYVLFTGFDNPKSLTTGYFLGSLFIIYIYSIFPVLKRIIGKSSQIKINIDLTNTLNINSFKNVSKYRIEEPIVVNEVLITLKKELDIYILSNNISAYEKINSEILTKALNLISDGENRKECDLIINGLIWLWRENCKVAVRVNDTNYFEFIWNQLRIVYMYFADIKAQLLYIQGLYYFVLFDFLKLHIKLNNSIPLYTALDCIEASFKQNLIKNCPEQKDLKNLVRMYEGGEFGSSNFNDSMQWDQIKDIIGYFGKIQETAIAMEDKNIFEESSRRIKNICYEINFDNAILGNYQKGYLTWRSLTSSYYNSSIALKNGLYENTMDCFEIPEFLIRKLIQDNNLAINDIRIIIRSIADNIIIAFKEKKLFMNKDYGTLNDFCMIGIHSLKHYKTNIMAKQTVDYIIKVLKHLKKIAEVDLTLINSNDYLSIKSKINQFADVAVRNNYFEEDEKLIRKLRKTCDEFKNVSMDNDFGIVKWKVD